MLILVPGATAWSQVVIGPELMMLVQRDPTPITFGGGLRVGLKLGPQWFLIGSAGATIRVVEQVDRIWGSPRMLAAGGVPQHNVGSIIHQRHHALVSAEWRSRDRGPHLAIGLGAGYYRYYRKIDLQITILESGDQHRSTYDRIEDSFLVLPYVGIRLTALGGEFYSDVGGMLVTHQSIDRNFLPNLRAGILWTLG